MVSVKVDKNRLLRSVQAPEEEVLEALAEIKCEFDKEEDGALLLEVTGDRPDLLSRQGVVRALKGYLREETGLPEIEVKQSGLVVDVKPSVKGIRPVIVAAAVKGVALDDASVAELMQIQEKLVLTHGRRRRKVAVGVHDFDKISFPLVYEAVAEKKFIPLAKEKEMGLKQILEGHEKGIDYAFILEGFDKYPIISDAKGQVVSFPPIINSAKTAVTGETRNLFIEITGTDFEACNTALNIMCQDFFDDGCAIESVEVRADGKKLVTPITKPQKMVLNCAYANQMLGLEASPNELAEFLRRQRIDAKVDGKTIECFIPAYRADFLHEIDLVEEVAIGYGYNRFQIKEPSVFTKGGRSEYSALIDGVRDLMVGAGYIELSTHVLYSPERAEKAFAGKDVVRIRNPVSSEYSCLRSSLLPPLLEVLSENTHEVYPQKIFEVGEVVVKDANSETKTRTDLHLCALVAHKTASLSEAASLLAKVLPEAKLKKAKSKQFIEGRCGEAVVGGEAKGTVGEVHPVVLENYGLQMPVSGFEVVLRKGKL